MKSNQSFFHVALTLVALTAGVWAQTQTASNVAPTSDYAAPAPVTAADIQSLRDALAAQQQEIQALQRQLQLRNQADAAPVPADQPPVAALVAAPVQPDRSANPAPNQEPNPDAAQTFNKQMEGPITIHFRGINITPGGYAEAAFVRRSRALGADLPTPFNSLTMPGASQSQIPEFFGSARQSKSTMFVDGRMKNVDLSSYVSADFLSAGVTSTSNQTNGYTFRLRQAWAQVKFDNGWSFLGGQIWSLVTENGLGISPDDDLGRTNDSRPKTIDPSYNVGFVFARQYGIRVTKSFGDKVTIAFALENPQATLMTHGNASNYLVGESGASNSFNTGASYSFNPAPDLIAKIAFDPGFGHYEVFGLLDRFTDRVFPCGEVLSTQTCGSAAAGVTSVAGAYNSSKEAGGFGASARWNIANRVTIGLKGFGGSGIGRYGPAGLADAAINANGTLHLLRNFEGLTTLEAHLTKKLDFVSYGGVEYAARAVSFDPLANKGAGAQVGYGATTFVNTACFAETLPGAGGFSPGTLGSGCTADTRAVIEGTAGIWYKFYSGPRGRFQYGTQYSYVTRNAWSGVGGVPHGIDNMVFSSFRYYLP